MEQYRLLAECLLPAHMLDWFDLQNVCVEKKDDTQIIHIYLDENEQKPDSRDGLRPNGFTRESVFHDFPIRGHEVLLHVRRRRWLDKENHNVMTEISNKDAHGRRGCIIAIVKGTKTKDVIKALKKTDKSLRKSVVEVSLDFSESMRSIVKACFPDVMITLDRLLTP